MSGPKVGIRPISFVYTQHLAYPDLQDQIDPPRRGCLTIMVYTGISLMSCNIVYMGRGTCMEYHSCNARYTCTCSFNLKVIKSLL